MNGEIFDAMSGMDARSNSAGLDDALITWTGPRTRSRPGIAFAITGVSLAAAKTTGDLIESAVLSVESRVSARHSARAT